MSRAGYTEDADDNWELIKWRGQVASATRGKRGQALFRELLEALDALPEKRLIAGDLVRMGEGDVLQCCTLGALGVKRGLDMSEIDPEDYDAVANAFDAKHQLVREIEWMNDELHYKSPEERWERMRSWVAKQIIPETV